MIEYRKIGVPLLDNEDNRVLLIPDDIKHLIKKGFSISITASAGLKAGYTNKEYKDAGANIVLDNIDLKNTDLLLMPSHKKFDFKVFENINICSILDENEKFLSRDNKSINNWFNLLSLKNDDFSVISDKQNFLAGQFLFYLIQGNQILNSGILFSKISGLEIPKIVIVGDSAFSQGFLKESLKSDCEITYIENDHSVLKVLNDKYSFRINTIFYTSSNFVKKIKEADIVICSGIKGEIIRQSDINDMKRNTLFIDSDFSRQLVDVKRDKNFYIYNHIKHYIANSNSLNQSILKTSSIYLSAIITDFLLNFNNYHFKYILKDGLLNEEYKKPEIAATSISLEQLLENEDDNEGDLSWLDINDDKDY